MTIWTDNYHQVAPGSRLDTVTFDGGTYGVHKSGNYIALAESTNVTAGTVNLLAFFDYIIAKGWMPSPSTFGAIDYGVELESTGGVNATFEVNDSALTANEPDRFGGGEPRCRVESCSRRRRQQSAMRHDGPE